MLDKLDARYDSKSTFAKISKMSELVYILYSTIRDDMAKHANRIAGLIEQLRNMGTTLRIR